MNNKGTACATVVILFAVAITFLGFGSSSKHLEQACTRYATTTSACARW